jgi:hypothetical protein
MARISGCTPLDWGIRGKRGVKGGDGSIFGTQAVGLCQKNRGILPELIEAGYTLMGYSLNHRPGVSSSGEDGG